jgi:hypothetical protein
MENNVKKNTKKKPNNVQYDILYMEIMSLKNRLNVLESLGTYQRTTTYINPQIKIEGEQC